MLPLLYYLYKQMKDKDMTNTFDLGEKLLAIFMVLSVVFLAYGVAYDNREKPKAKELHTVVTKEQQCAIDRNVSRCIFIN